MPNVTVRIERGTETAGDGQEKQEAKREDSKKQPVASPTAMLFYHQAIATGKQIIGYAASNVANFTGDYIKQEGINFGMEIAGDISSIAMGAISKGWAGAIVAAVGVTTKRVLQVVSEVQSEVHARHERDYLVKRSGNSTTNGSRGTEN